jgi:2-keto-4-pentenoate hydratase/2-oxohepta-3-ene-1,7-dioic acid hydratase in catechol pathway
MSNIEIAFGIATAVLDGEPATAVVVHDQVALLADIIARHSTQTLAAPLARDFMRDWDRWHDWLRGLDLEPVAGAGWRSLDSVTFMAPVPEPWNIFQTYHNYERPSRSTGRRDPPKSERVLPDIFLGSRSALAGYGATVHCEHGTTQFDFELEVTGSLSGAGRARRRLCGRIRYCK